MAPLKETLDAFKQTGPMQMLRRTGALAGRLGASGLLNLGEGVTTRISRNVLDNKQFNYSINNAGIDFGFGFLGRVFGEGVEFGTRKIFKFLARFDPSFRLSVNKRVQNAIAPVNQRLNQINNKLDDISQSIRKWGRVLDNVDRFRDGKLILGNRKYWNNPVLNRSLLAVQQKGQQMINRSLNQRTALLAEQRVLNRVLPRIRANAISTTPLPRYVGQSAFVFSTLAGDSEPLPVIFDFLSSNINSAYNEVEIENNVYKSLGFNYP